MRVLLLRPDSRMTLAPVPLGLGYLAEALRRRRRDEIRILDARNLHLDAAGVAARAREFAPDVVGVTSAHMDRREAHAAVAAIKSDRPQARVVFGGAYATATPEAALADPHTDAAVIGEGEETFVELLDAWDGGRTDLSAVRGLAWRDGGKFRRTGPRPPIADIDPLVPAWDLLDPRSYYGVFKRNAQNRIRKDHRVVPIVTSRGCPYHCIFCHNLFGRRIRFRSPAAVAEEVELLAGRWGAREIEIVDDCFNIDVARAKEIFRRLEALRLGLHFTFPNGLRGDRVDAELPDLFRAAGVFRVSYAVESGSPRIQALIEKRLDLDRVRQAITDTARRGIVTAGYFILGLPTETADEMRATVDFAAASDLHVADFFYLQPFPGTRAAELAGAQGLDAVDFGDYSTMSLNVSAASDEELRRVMHSANRRFYLNPVRIARILRVVPWNTQLLLNVLITARLFFEESAAR